MKKFIDKLNEIEAKAVQDRDEATRAHAEVISLMEAENARDAANPTNPYNDDQIRRENKATYLARVESMETVPSDHHVGKESAHYKSAKAHYSDYIFKLCDDQRQGDQAAKRFYDKQVSQLYDEAGLTDKQRQNESSSFKRLAIEAEKIKAINIDYSNQVSVVKSELKFENQSHPAFTNYNTMKAGEKIEAIDKAACAKASKLLEAGKKDNTLMLFSYVRHGNTKWQDFPSVTYLITKFAEDHPRIWPNVTPNCDHDFLVGNIGYALLELAIKVNGKCVNEIEAFAAGELTLEDVSLCKSLFNAMLKGNKGEYTYITGDDVVDNVMTIFDHVNHSSCEWSSFVSARTLIRYFGNDHPNVYLNPLDKPGSVYRVSDIGYALLGLAIELDGKCEKEYHLFTRGILTYDDIIAASPMLKSISAQAAIEYLRDRSSQRGQSDQSGIEYP